MSLTNEARYFTYAVIVQLVVLDAGGQIVRFFLQVLVYKMQLDPIRMRTSC